MAVVWTRGAATVKEVAACLSRERAYNTVQTTLERLYRKSLLLREKQSHAFVYKPRLDRAGYHRHLISRFVRDLLQDERGSVLAAFVDTAADVDLENLERLENLIHLKRASERSRR